MHAHAVRLRWRGDTGAGYEHYGRTHEVEARPGPSLTVSAHPAFLGDAEQVDPEQLLVAAAASCQLLSFLAVAARARLSVVSYDDDAVGTLSAGNDPRSVDRIVLRPRITVAGGRRPPTPERVAHLVELAHRECYIANSLRSVVEVRPHVEIAPDA